MERLIMLDDRYKQQWIEYIKEIVDSGETTMPAGFYYEDKGLRDILKTNNEPNVLDHVATKTYWLISDESNKLIGVINVRPDIENNYYLSTIGGNIGYEIRPSERNKGYGTKMLKLGLDECRKFGLKQVLIVCLENNIGSKKVIENNRGILENKIVDNMGNIYLRYWINI